VANERGISVTELHVLKGTLVKEIRASLRVIE
jgi:hypothetical protein